MGAAENLGGRIGLRNSCGLSGFGMQSVELLDPDGSFFLRQGLGFVHLLKDSCGSLLLGHVLIPLKLQFLFMFGTLHNVVAKLR